MSNVRNFGATGDGKTDDSEAIEHALKDGTGVLEFPRGNFRITKPIVIDLSKTGRTSIVGRSGIVVGTRRVRERMPDTWIDLNVVLFAKPLQGRLE